MLSRFFIDRPIFAWVVAIIIMLFGVISITRLPIARYPNIAPPSVTISASYPGRLGADGRGIGHADHRAEHDRARRPDLHGSRPATTTATSVITLTFASGTNPDIAQVQVQNRLQQAVPLLPQIVQQQGISVSKSTGTFLLAIGLRLRRRQHDRGRHRRLAGHQRRRSR